jgi:hypothetical protein
MYHVSATPPKQLIGFLWNFTQLPSFFLWKYKLNYLPFQILDSDRISSCTSAGSVLQMCKVSQKSNFVIAIFVFNRKLSCLPLFKVWGGVYRNHPVRPSIRPYVRPSVHPSIHVPCKCNSSSCTSAGSVLQMCKVSQKSNKPFRRSCAYKVHALPPFRESIRACTL